MAVEPYLNFNGHSEEAIEFYTQVLGASVVMIMRFKDAPQGVPVAPGSEHKIMHAALDVDGTTVMLSDARCTGELAFEGVSLSLQVADVATGQARFDALAEGGAVEMPFGKTFWAEGFGMLRDRFGVSWMINVAQ
ncbi:MAG: VOC family protein [Gammaproteobacteria bacterium]|nr:VOC family protein [Gammaproteobacteria bacterium]